MGDKSKTTEDLQDVDGGMIDPEFGDKDPLEDASGGPDTVAPIITDALVDVEGGGIHLPPVNPNA